MTDQQLKLQLAKMLPEKITTTLGVIRNIDTDILCWKAESTLTSRGCKILETEWLHVCWLVEQTLDKRKCDMFANYLGQLVDKAWIDVGATRVVTSTKVVSASWQQRAEALCKVNNIMIAYFTFGQSHEHIINGKIFDKDCVVKITADDPRAKMFEIFGRKWAMQYNESPNLDYFPRGIIEL